MQVNQDELRRALIEQARRYPGQEKFVYEYYEKNPAALVELRAPIFEDKVVDHILEQAKPADKKVTVEELLKSADEDERRTAPSATTMRIITTITTMITITTMATMTTTTGMTMHHDHEHDHDHGHHHHDHGHDHGPRRSERA